MSSEYEKGYDAGCRAVAKRIRALCDDILETKRKFSTRAVHEKFPVREDSGALPETVTYAEAAGLLGCSYHYVQYLLGRKQLTRVAGRPAKVTKRSVIDYRNAHAPAQRGSGRP